MIIWDMGNPYRQKLIWDILMNGKVISMWSEIFISCRRWHGKNIRMCRILCWGTVWGHSCWDSIWRCMRKALRELSLWEPVIRECWRFVREGWSAGSSQRSKDGNTEVHLWIIWALEVSIRNLNLVRHRRNGSHPTRRKGMNMCGIRCVPIHLHWEPIIRCLPVWRFWYGKEVWNGFRRRFRCSLRQDPMTR